MSAFRLTPAAIFVSGAIALLSSVGIAGAQDAGTDGSKAAAPKSQPQPQSPSERKESHPPAPSKNPGKSAAKAAPKRNQGPLPQTDTAATAPTTAGCGWIGKRVIHSLLRDDAVTAQDFDRLYHNFTCSPEHLRAAFDCTVAVGALPTAQEAQTRVDSCWTDPKFDAKSTKIGPATDLPTASGAAPANSASGQSKSGGKAAPAAGASGGSTPNYPAPRP